MLLGVGVFVFNNDNACLLLEDV